GEAESPGQGLPERERVVETEGQAAPAQLAHDVPQERRYLALGHSGQPVQGPDLVAALLEQSTDVRQVHELFHWRIDRLKVTRPVEQLRQARLLGQLELPQLQQYLDRLAPQLGRPHLVQFEDLAEIGAAVGGLDVVKYASPQKRGRQRLLLVVGDEDDRPQVRPVAGDREAQSGRLGYFKRHLVE